MLIAYGLNEAKNALINGKVHKILEVTKLTELKIGT